MQGRHLILLGCLISFIQSGFSQNSSGDERLLRIIREEGQAEVTIPYTDRKSIDLLTVNVSITSVRNNLVYIKLSSHTVDWFLLQKFDYHISDESQSKMTFSEAGQKQSVNWDWYPGYSQYDSIMQSFGTLYPALCKLDTIGTSVNGRLVLALKISDNAGTDEDEPEVFYTSTMHGDETAGFVLMLHFADYLLKNYNTSSRVKNLTDGLEIWINPLANPDGAYRSGNVISALSTRANANGYDLNRNFPDPGLSYGPGREKQKETIDMEKFLRKHRFTLSANFHSGVEIVNYPWDRWYSRLHADDTWFNSISRAYADTVHQYSGPAYMNYLDNGITRGAEWYVIMGGRQDFVTYELQGREVTIELADPPYITPAAQLPLLWQYNYLSFIGYLENALYGIHGRIIDDVTSEPVAAKVSIIAHDKDNSHVYSDTLSGNFIRMLSPGSWNLSLAANGYRDTVITNVQVMHRQKTDLMIRMTPTLNNIDTLIPASPLLFPNPASLELKALLPDGFAGPVHIRIYSQTGVLLSDYEAVYYQGTPMIIDIRESPQGLYSIQFRNKASGSLSTGRFIIIK